MVRWLGNRHATQADDIELWGFAVSAKVSWADLGRWIQRNPRSKNTQQPSSHRASSSRQHISPSPYRHSRQRRSRSRSRSGSHDRHHHSHSRSHSRRHESPSPSRSPHDKRRKSRKGKEPMRR